VSGASFLTTVLIGRSSLPNQLGAYAIAAGILIWLTNAQQALISLPYTIQRSSEPRQAALQAGQALLLATCLAAIAVFGIGIASFTALLSERHPDVFPIMLALAGIAPFVMYRDFARRLAFADFRNFEALIFDVVVVVVQLGALEWLAWTGQLTSISALAAFGFACAVSLVFWFRLVHGRFRFARAGFGDTVRNSWSVGKWLFANQILNALQTQMTLWLVALAVGATATGIYTACLSIALFANPIILGLINMLWAKAARAFQESGGARLLRESIADAALLGIMLGAFCIPLVFWGDDVLTLLYPSNHYAGYGHVVTVLAFSQLLFGISMPAVTALAGMGLVRLNFVAAAIETTLLGLVVWFFVFHWGISGAAYGMLIGCALRFTVRWTLVLAILWWRPRIQRR
jgi:O-antigen/teichoic acid export membrane protein